MSARALRWGASLAVLYFAIGTAVAGSFSVDPVRLTLTAGAPIVALAIRNSGAEAAVIQLEPTSWTQRDGVDLYEPTRDLIATPPIFTLPPHGTQIVRLGLRRASDPRAELSYRLYLVEVPPPPPPDFVGTRVALRLGVPVFVTPATPSAQALQWQLVRRPDSKLAIAARNHGALHARIQSVSLSRNDGAAVSGQTIADDVHAGQERQWLIQGSAMPAPGSTLRLSASTERGEVSADVVVP
ncbi:fimbrial chaperone protein [Variovorax paradoxus]|uniref:fimbrial biogenesis chaperone n=1 Tax=Variovorax paradoxus TaxID=34073 RepID=UPI00279093FB|nr:fimbria/pilus periplasmic chaperone [Variovorax paradoxus]MDQ0570036.1 fimbrial chaperone protein [Variovorax paradoxus]